VSIESKDRDNSKLKIKDLQNSTLKIEDLQTTSSFRWTSASRSHPGRVRQVNEDACLDQPEHELWAVADGKYEALLGRRARQDLLLEGANSASAAPADAAYFDSLRKRLRRSCRV